MCHPQPNHSFAPITGDRQTPAETASLPVSLVLDTLRSAFNVGNVFRIAEAVGVAEIIACGYTPCPPHPKLEKTARGCDALVPCRHAESAAVILQELRHSGTQTVAVETVTDAVPIWEFEITFPVAFVFGNEALGINPDALDQCEHAVCLPCRGRKNSINVGNCAAVALYEALRQWKQRDCTS